MGNLNGPQEPILAVAATPHNFANYIPTIYDKEYKSY